jgi:eukaryotic-like serine/threonine-protein kinase
MKTLLGTTLDGRYRLDEQIGIGGMSTVYRAFDTVLERPVAIKLMNREIASDSDQLERFRREARSVAQLSHPHIVSVIDAGEEDNTPFIVLEYVDGETLKSLIRRDGPLEPAEAIAYAIEIARALDCAHERYIVHRDVKPQNVLLGAEGGAKITDFGIARMLTEEGLTIDGRVLGTTDYVSPEQALGQSVTGQSDIYSLGVVLYEMLAGCPPFRGDTPVAVAMRHVREDLPDVQLARPEVSAATAAVVDRATAKDLTARYPDMPSMIVDLEHALATETARSGHTPAGEVTSVMRTLPTPTRHRIPWSMRHRARWIALLGLLAAAGVVVLVLAAGSTHRGTGVAPNVVAKPGLVPVALGQASAHDYNPFGTGPEHRAQVSNIVDGDPNTAWSTQHYLGGNLGQKPGMGVYVDAAPGLVARAVELQTGTPGFYAAVYAARAFDSQIGFGSPEPLAARGWTLLSAAQPIKSRTTITLPASSTRYRYYLAWITKLPPHMESASINELTLFR